MNTETQLEVTTPEPDLATMKRADVPAIWDGYRTQLEKLKATAETLVVTDISQTAEMKLARVTRLALKDLRVEVEHRRKELGEEFLRRTQAINADAKKLKELIEPLEDRLLEQEQFADRKAAEDLRLKVQRRTEQLAKFWTVGMPMPDLGALTVDQFDTLLEDTETAHTARLERERKAKEEAELRARQEELRRERAMELAPLVRFITVKLDKLGEMPAETYAGIVRDAKAAEKADLEKQEQQRVENERLKKEADAREAQMKAEREKAAVEAKAAAEKARKEREAIEDKARQEAIAAQKAREAEQAKFEAEAKKEREAAAAENARLAGIAEEQRQKAAEATRIAREAREKAEAELSRQKAAEEAKQKADADAAKKAARAPDREKLTAFAAMVGRIVIPAFSSTEGKALTSEIANRIQTLAEWLQAQAKTL